MPGFKGEIVSWLRDLKIPLPCYKWHVFLFREKWDPLAFPVQPYVSADVSGSTAVVRLRLSRDLLVILVYPALQVAWVSLDARLV